MGTNRIILTIIIALLTTNVLAQLKVNSDGTANIGAYNNQSYGALRIGADGYWGGGISLYDSRYRGTPFNIYRSSDLVYMTRGIGGMKGLKMTNSGQIILGQYSNGWSSVGQGHLAVFTSTTMPSISAFNENMVNYGDIIRSYAHNPLATLYAGWYIDENNAWHKNFGVLANGDVYSRGLLLLSDETAKKNIETIDSPLQKVLKLRGVSYNFKSDDLIKDKQFKAIGQSLGSEEQSTQISPDLFNSIKAESSRKHIGVIAQEVEAVVPEVVRTTFDGKKAVSYVDLIGLLIEAIKEQQIQIDELRGQKTPSNPIIKSTPSENSTKLSSIVLDNKLYQNAPNPFSNSTEIRYYISDKATNANLYIYNMQGSQIKNIANLMKGNNVITINGYELKAGMYIYSLIVDGTEVDTKRMILTD